VRHLPIYGGEDLRIRSETREIVAEALLQSVDPIDLTQKVCDGLDETVRSLGAKGFPGGPPPACAAGCAHCCRGNPIDVTPFEAIAIVRYVRSTTDASAISALKKAVEETERDACVFLHEERCAIYEARPLACRHAHSTDSAACASRLAAVPQNGTLVANTAGLILGFREGCARAGNEMGAYDLRRALAIALAEPDAEARFLRGEDRFASARTKSPEALRELLTGNNPEHFPFGSTKATE
jgi:uncharacterized protein